MSFGMMKIEQDFLEVMVEYVPRIAQALEKIAEGAKDSTTGEAHDHHAEHGHG